jgi:hydroxymethylpyrimidine/phosphomethylpyrimidine kinase
VTEARRIPRVLAIAGSDSGGGAGIQADLKAFAASGVHGMTAITAITAQNTIEVAAIHSVPPETIIAQIRAVASDIGVDAVKIGMLGTEETIRAVGRALDELPPGTPVVLDPVMVAESGAELLDPGARRALVDVLITRATVVTPNLPEARVLSGLGEDAGPEVLGRAVLALGPAAVVVTGGHAENATDTFLDDSRVVEIGGRRIPGGASHGSGCTHSSALAARLALGDTPLEAARAARQIAAEAVANGDVDVAEDEQRLIEEFRRQLDAGLWAAVPSETSGRRQARMVRSFDEIPRDADRVIFFPRAAGG